MTDTPGCDSRESSNDCWSNSPSKTLLMNGNVGWVTSVLIVGGQSRGRKTRTLVLSESNLTSLENVLFLQMWSKSWKKTEPLPFI